jgi:hypothetical protein
VLRLFFVQESRKSDDFRVDTLLAHRTSLIAIGCHFEYCYSLRIPYAVTTTSSNLESMATSFKIDPGNQINESSALGKLLFGSSKNDIRGGVKIIGALVKSALTVMVTRVSRKSVAEGRKS